MPVANWELFKQLPGSVEANFEALCRALIRRHYGQYGNFAALASQPGVEFHLKLHSTCSLGQPNGWYGWQCRWYELSSGRAIGNTRKKKIIKAIETTKRVLPNLTDWVLWTRYPLTAADQKWFYALKTNMRLHLWTAAEVEEHLSGEAAILRSTYFGELILTPSSLESLHTEKVAPIRQRWLPDVHQIVDTERILRKVIGEVGAWQELSIVANQLEKDSSAVAVDRSELSNPLADSVDDLLHYSQATIKTLSSVYTALGHSDINDIHHHLAIRQDHPNSTLNTLPRRLRTANSQATLTVTNLLNENRKACKLLDEFDQLFRNQLLVVLADAGHGKTQLAAQLTMRNGERAAGILLHGRELQAGQTLNNLARNVVIHGNQVPTFEALIAAVDAAGQRNNQRLPIVIDGLNEAEDPRNWKALLSTLSEVLKPYPYVLIVCTLRKAFAEEALPPEINRLEIPDFGDDAGEAIRRYFAHYRINPLDAHLPFELLRHPLTLRLFCEVTNPMRDKEVRIEALPGSLTSLFERYLDHAAERIAELAPRAQRLFKQDVYVAVDKIGITLWDEHTRDISESNFRENLNDNQRTWDGSIVRALENEGIILRVPGKVPGEFNIAGVYDAFAGHLVAKSLLVRRGSEHVEEWLKSPDTFAKLAGPFSGLHPLATDIFNAIVGLLPLLHHKQLWTLLDEPLRNTALYQTADLDGAHLDTETTSELAKLTIHPSPNSRELLNRFWQTRGAPAHPLNSDFLDDILRTMPVADRDMRWTEWIRLHRDDILADSIRLEKRWHARVERSKADELRARWTMWLLTSTVREIRDQATRSLYWFGRYNPTALFGLTIESLSINDFYVPERMLAASYGVVMANQLADADFRQTIAAYLIQLRDCLIGPNATNPTDHWLARLYVEGIATFANIYYPDAIPDGFYVNDQIPFAPGPVIDGIPSNDTRAGEVNRTFGMDFENYTLGRLFENRRNYDNTHAGHQAAVAHVRGQVWSLGWREDGLGSIDRDMVRYESRHEKARIERYGKKYGWLGYYTYAGMLADQGLLPLDERFSDLQIDPSFPESPLSAPLTIPIWASPTPKDDKKWLREGRIEIPNDLLFKNNFDSYPGSWIAVNGYLETSQETSNRRVFAIMSALLVASHQAKRLIKALENYNSQHNSPWRLPKVPDNYYSFAGEIPWSPYFAQNNSGSKDGNVYRSHLKVDSGLAIPVEILTSSFTWESHHSKLNQAGLALVPSDSFSKMFNLRGIPQSFNQSLPDATTAALSFKAPAGLNGNLLYLREDLVHKYAAGRELIWFIWGERELKSESYLDTRPDWQVKIWSEGEDIWRYICRGEKLSRMFRTSRNLKSGKEKSKVIRKTKVIKKAKAKKKTRS